VFPSGITLRMSPSVPVTVIVPIRNAARTVRTAIESVLGQIPPPAEVICVDGASTDHGASIVRTLGVAVFPQQGRGIANARNQGIRASTSPWVAFCDADDRWAPDALQVRLRCLTAAPGARAVVGRVVREALTDTPATPAQAQLIGHSVPGFTPGALLAERALFDDIGPFDETLTIGADSDWFVRLEASGWPAHQLDDIVLYKGVRDTSLSADVATYRRELLTIARRFIVSRRGSTPR
jgi:glycosyltransferase involved in cell wall biosynthesis